MQLTLGAFSPHLMMRMCPVPSHRHHDVGAFILPVMRSKQRGYLEIEFGSGKVPEPKFPALNGSCQNLQKHSRRHEKI